jgi:putative ABC transport system permease protein
LPGNNLTYNISVLTVDPKQIDGAISEATGLFRTIRGLRSFEENNFSITKSDSMVNMMLENVGMIGLAAVIIGIITLFGAAIGLMNIMLVSVSERTREIGIRKALGATQKIIRNQFLVEAIVIAQIGGLLGVVLGIGVGNGVAKMIGGDFIIPWQWMILGFSLCFVVAILSGFIPAYRASKLDPIESLRYE